MLLFYLSLVDSPEDKHKVEQLYNKYEKVMFYTAMKILNDKFRAEDAVHQTFINIIKNIGTIRDVLCPQTSSYCVISCKRVAIDILRREHTDRYVEVDDLLSEIPDKTDIEEEIICKMDLETIIDKVLKLPDIYRDVFYLHYSNGCSLKQIAKTLNISTEAAKKRLQRAKQQIILMLQEKGVDQEWQLQALR
jgi:RNA polymerase sigma-70 factor (ECF subfamily)